MNKYIAAFSAGLVFIAVLMGIASGPAFKDVRDAVQAKIEKKELAGAVTLITTKDRVLRLDAAGYADIAANKTMQPDSLFWIASMTKPFISTALMMLVDENKVSLDDAVEKYLPDFKPRIYVLSKDGKDVRLDAPEKPITLRSLLNHTSGLITGWTLSPYEDMYPLATRVKSYSLSPLLFAPTSDYAYSSAGIDTAGRIIEVVTHMPIEQFLQQRIFQGLRMVDTTFWPTPSQLSRLAKSYAPDSANGGLKEIPIWMLHGPFTDHETRFPFPGGGLFSTASDLGRFCQMLLNDGVFEGRRYLSEASIREIRRNSLSGRALETFKSQWGGTAEGLEGYSVGWNTRGPGAISHAGADNTDMLIDFKRGVAAVWLIQGGAVSVIDTRSAFERAATAQFGTTQ